MIKIDLASITTQSIRKEYSRRISDRKKPRGRLRAILFKNMRKQMDLGSERER